MGTSDLDTELLKLAYTRGYFPMPHPETQEILWFSPDPRAILPLAGFHQSRSLRRRIAKGTLSATLDRDFTAVMDGCADRHETWINAEFKRAYTVFFSEGLAHSVEVWEGGKLVGGVYGVAIGGAFFAESMFSRVTDASKVALMFLVQHLRVRGFVLLEVQFLTPHLQSLGAIAIPAARYLGLLRSALKTKVSIGTTLLEA